MSKTHLARITIPFSDSRVAITIFEAIKVEIFKERKSVKASFSQSRNILLLEFETESISSIRALVNTYLRWIITANRIVDELLTINEITLRHK